MNKPKIVHHGNKVKEEVKTFTEIEKINAGFELSLLLILEMRFGDGAGQNLQVKLAKKEIMGLFSQAHSKWREEMKENIEAKKKSYKEKMFIDATPDGNYALRILQAYRRDCDMIWSDNIAGLKIKNPLLKELNKLQELRAKELDKAIDNIISLIKK